MGDLGNGHKRAMVTPGMSGSLGRWDSRTWVYQERCQGDRIARRRMARQRSASESPTNEITRLRRVKMPLMSGSGWLMSGIGSPTPGSRVLMYANTGSMPGRSDFVSVAGSCGHALMIGSTAVWT
jgi:hypothetical protein